MGEVAGNTPASVTEFVKHMEDKSLKDDLFSRGDKDHDMGVKVDDIMAWAKDNGLDMTKEQAEEIVAFLDELRDSGNHLDLVELEHFMETGEQAEKGITGRV